MGFLRLHQMGLMTRISAGAYARVFAVGARACGCSPVGPPWISILDCGPNWGTVPEMWALPLNTTTVAFVNNEYKLMRTKKQPASEVVRQFTAGRQQQLFSFSPVPG